MSVTTRPTAASKPAPAPKPRPFEDLPWRAGYRVRRLLMTIWGPPQLDDAHDPLQLLARRRAQRYAARAAARTQPGAAPDPTRSPGNSEGTTPPASDRSE